MKITKQQLKEIIKKKLNEAKPLALRMDRERRRKAAMAAPQETEWVLRRSGTTDATAFLIPSPASDQKEGKHKWGAKEAARTFKGENGKGRAEDEQKKLKEKGTHVSVEKK
jgi:hypothetical protein